MQSGQFSRHMPRRYYLETFGCQMNVRDSERMAGLLSRAGLEATPDPERADVIVLNTCSVRTKAEEKVYSRLGVLRHLRDRGRHPLFVVAGCVAQQEGQALLRRAPYVDLVLGTQAIVRLPELLRRLSVSREALVDTGPSTEDEPTARVARRSNPVRASITIVEGCNDQCSYCVVPSTRGFERHRRAGEILAEVREAVSEGCREILLLGQIVNDYRDPDDPACDLPALLEQIHEVPGVVRIRFASPHPRHVTPRLIAGMQRLPKVCRHLHLPVQSGSTRILDAMRRQHTREDYLALVDRLRAAMPNLAVSTDLIVGFPGESAEDFEHTMTLLAAVRFSSVFAFKYTPRPNTFAFNNLVDDVPQGVKAERLARLQAAQRAIQLDLHQAMVGTVQEVLLDSHSRRGTAMLSGRTSGNTVVNVPGDEQWLGRVVSVCITGAGPHSLAGRVLDEGA